MEYLKPCQACPLCHQHPVNGSIINVWQGSEYALSVIINGADTNKTTISIPKLQNLTELRISRKYVNYFSFSCIVKSAKNQVYQKYWFRENDQFRLKANKTVISKNIVFLHLARTLLIYLFIGASLSCTLFRI